MNWLQKIQAKPQAEKMRIIWTVVIVAAVLLILVWIISSKFHKQTGTDTTLFQTIGRGFHDVKNNYGK